MNILHFEIYGDDMCYSLWKMKKLCFLHKSLSKSYFVRLGTSVVAKNIYYTKHIICISGYHLLLWKGFQNFDFFHKISKTYLEWYTSVLWTEYLDYSFMLFQIPSPCYTPPAWLNELRMEKCFITTHACHPRYRICHSLEWYIWRWIDIYCIYVISAEVPQ